MLNGQRVQDAEMTDGDILVIADVEFTFFTERSVSSYSMATEVMGAGGTVVESEQTRAAVRALRRLQQSLTQRAVDVQFQPVVDLASRRVFGHEAERSTAGEQLCEQLVLAAASRVAGRLFQLSRLVAVEEALRYGLGGNLFLPVESGEIGSEGLLDSLARLARPTPAGHRLVVAIQESGACDIPYFQSLCIRLRELGVGIAYHGFAGTRAHVAEKQGISPDFLMLDPKLTSDIHREAERQRQVQAIARACHDIGCATIASGLATEDAVRPAASWAASTAWAMSSVGPHAPLPWRKNPSTILSTRRATGEPWPLQFPRSGNRSSAMKSLSGSARAAMAKYGRPSRPAG